MSFQCRGSLGRFLFFYSIAKYKICLSTRRFTERVDFQSLGYRDICAQCRGCTLNSFLAFDVLILLDNDSFWRTRIRSKILVSSSCHGRGNANFPSIEWEIVRLIIALSRKIESYTRTREKRLTIGRIIFRYFTIQFGYMTSHKLWRSEWHQRLLFRICMADT